MSELQGQTEKVVRAANLRLAKVLQVTRGTKQAAALIAASEAGYTACEAQLQAARGALAAAHRMETEMMLLGTWSDGLEKARQDWIIALDAARAAGLA